MIKKFDKYKLDTLVDHYKMATRLLDDIDYFLKNPEMEFFNDLISDENLECYRNLGYYENETILKYSGRKIWLSYKKFIEISKIGDYDNWKRYYPDDKEYKKLKDRIVDIYRRVPNKYKKI